MMEVRGSGLFRTFMHTLETTQPQFFRLTDDRFWVAKPELLDGGETVLTLQGFDYDGNEVLHWELYRVGPEESVPYCRLTNQAVVLLHAPEDTLDAEEDKALTLRWFPYDALTEQVWRIEPSQLPGELSGIIQIWDDPDRALLTLQGTFLREDDVLNAYIKLDLDARRLTLLWSAAPGVHKGEPKLPRPFDGPDEEKLVINMGFISLVDKIYKFPSDSSIHPFEIKADDTRCTVVYQFFPPLPEDIDLTEELTHKTGCNSPKDLSIETLLKGMGRLAELQPMSGGSVSGPHYSFFFPTTIEGWPIIIDLKSGISYLRFDNEPASAPRNALNGGAFFHLYEDGVLEADRSFADAYLSQPCRNSALYADELCYRWRMGDGGATVTFELPAFFPHVEPLSLWGQLRVYCRDYLRGMNLLDWQPLQKRYFDNLDASQALIQELSRGIVSETPPSEE